MRGWLRLFMALCAAVLVVGGCADTDPTSAPVMPARRAAVVVGEDGRQYTLVEGQIRARRSSASAWIDRKGGWAFLEGDYVNGRQTMHVLYVPENAVKKRTLFTISIASDQYVKVELRAQVQQGGGELRDVGHNGFSKPVLLALDFSNAINVGDPSRLTILYDPEYGRAHQKVGGQIIAGFDNWVIGYLGHFSKYALAMD